MAIDFSNALVKLKTTSVVCSTVATIMTITRLYLHRKRLWWDDGMAFFSMLCLFVQVASAFMHVPDPAVLSKTSRIAAYYILSASFYAIIWSARIAILLTILRVEWRPSRQRYLRIAVVVFGVCALLLIGQLFWVCEPEGPSWMNEPNPQCKLNTQVAISQVVTDILSDLFLCVWPLRIISVLRNERLKRRLKIIFCINMITSSVSLVHVGYLLTTGGTNLLIVALVENNLALMVANVPVLSMNILHRMGVIRADTHIDLNDDDDGAGVATTLNAMTLRFENHPVPPPKTKTYVQSVNLVAMANERNQRSGTAQHTLDSSTFLIVNSSQLGSFKVPGLHPDEPEDHYRSIESFPRRR